eukprot:TRINITY_DN11218_c0_g1_i1.p1 TRINITY_DN11218_c0_g1~~TRINITY_DN11218_c0_g1_i1.p1  ORF type:complete len:482 (-),score=88.01 TRINITY_DN11218_c0_g1_i1:21-1424(-)
MASSQDQHSGASDVPARSDAFLVTASDEFRLATDASATGSGGFTALTDQDQGKDVAEALATSRSSEQSLPAVSVGTTNGQLVVFSGGKVIWKKDIADRLQFEEGVWIHINYAVKHVLFSASGLQLLVGTESGRCKDAENFRWYGQIALFDTETGKQTWKWSAIALGTPRCLSVGLLDSAPSRDCLAAMLSDDEPLEQGSNASQHDLVYLDVKTGHLIWKRALEQERAGLSLTHSRDSMFVIVGFSDPQEVMCFSADSGCQVWASPISSTMGGGLSDLQLGFSACGQFVACATLGCEVSSDANHCTVSFLAAATGQVKWNADVGVHGIYGHKINLVLPSHNEHLVLACYHKPREEHVAGACNLIFGALDTENGALIQKTCVTWLESDLFAPLALQYISDSQVLVGASVQEGKSAIVKLYRIFLEWTAQAEPELLWSCDVPGAERLHSLAFQPSLLIEESAQNLQTKTS